jgi:hypothetical protein
MVVSKRPSHGRLSFHLEHVFLAMLVLIALVVIATAAF